jgi:acyl carrier protein
MMLSHTDEVAPIVFEQLGRLIAVPPHRIESALTLDGDLRADRDDIDFNFLRSLERTFDIKVPAYDWNRVKTVQDVIDVVAKYRELKARGPERVPHAVGVIRAWFDALPNGLAQLREEERDGAWRITITPSVPTLVRWSTMSAALGPLTWGWVSLRESSIFPYQVL